MEHHKHLIKIKKEKKMKKILNFRKWIGPVFSSLVFVFAILSVNSKDPAIMTLWFILPMLSYGFTMLYLSKEGPGWLTTIMTLLLMALPVALGIASVNSFYLQTGSISYIIARILCAVIPVVGIVYGFEQILSKQEDNFFEMNIQNPI